MLFSSQVDLTILIKVNLIFLYVSPFLQLNYNYLQL